VGKSGRQQNGLQLNAATGAVTGTPSVANTFNFTIKAEAYLGNAATGCSGTRNYSIVIVAIGTRTMTVDTLQGLAVDGSQDLASPSGDGVANLLKYAFNMAPTPGDLTKPNVALLQPGGSAGLPWITRDEQGRLVIEFVRRKTATNPGITYVVETSGDLFTWSTLELMDATIASIDNVWERVTIVDPTIGAKRFGRVRVTR
jgi:hypothetical protein